jgi:hypothetical protein
VSSQHCPGMDRCSHFDLGKVIHTVLRLAGREIFTNTRTIQAPDEEEQAPPQQPGVLEKGGAAKALVLAKLPYVALMLCITTRFHVHAKPVMSTLIEFYIPQFVLWKPKCTPLVCGPRSVTNRDACGL